ncbi:MAG TPA: GntR family transcriptional regulator [Candidatus Saccharimonadales bacterium]|nr:GntR family transcriptional regulator [Candidatus Saccharimonadales bacterium]
MNNLAPTSDSETPRVRTISDPCDRLREAIVSGEFQPNERLVEADLSVRFGAGRTAIRAALAVLDQEGLIVREPHRGARVRLISAREAFEIEQVRNALERLLARSAASRATSGDVADLQVIVATMHERLREADTLGYMQLNAQLHRRIWSISDNQVAIKMLVTLKSQSIRFQYGTILRPGRPEQSLREHEAIVAAIIAHDPDVCDAAMAEHLGHVLETLQWAIDSQERARPWSALRESTLRAQR